MICTSWCSCENERGIQNYGKTYQFESTWNPAVFHGNRSGIYEKPEHALENIWLTRNKYTIHKEVAISQVFHDNVTYDNLFYMGRFDFVVYEKRGKSELPVFAIELDGKEHFEDEVVRERDRQKNEICKAHHMQIIRVENSYARRYHYIKEILNDYLRRHVKNFAFKHPAKSGMMSLCITQDKGENNTIWKKRAGNY